LHGLFPSRKTVTVTARYDLAGAEFNPATVAENPDSIVERIVHDSVRTAIDVNLPDHGGVLRVPQRSGAAAKSPVTRSPAVQIRRGLQGKPVTRQRRERSHRVFRRFKRIQVESRQISRPAFATKAGAVCSLS